MLLPVPFARPLSSFAFPVLAKNVYGRLFNWLVKRLNLTMVSHVPNTRYIGVLDIFGFEIFKVNSFEQLCINYCNEKLQQHFNNHVFKQEKRCYDAEGISFTEVRVWMFPQLSVFGCGNRFLLLSALIHVLACFLKQLCVQAVFALL